MTAMRRAWARGVSLLAIAVAATLACSAPAPTPAAEPATPAPPATTIATELPSQPDIATESTPHDVPTTTQTHDAPQAAPMPAPAPPPTPMTQTPPAPEDPSAQPATITISMLSRGKGVPPETRAAYKRIRALLESRGVSDLQTQRIGIEGETRLCAGFHDARDAEAALDEIRKIAGDVELLEVTTSACPTNKDKTP